MKEAGKVLGILCVIILMLIISAGCGAGTKDMEHMGDEDSDSGKNPGGTEEGEKIAQLYQSIYEQATEDDREDVEIMERIIRRLEEHGMTAIDGDNQINMVNAGKAEEFIRHQESGERGELTVIRLLYPNGFAKYDMRTEERKVSVIRDYYEYQDGRMEHGSHDQYEAAGWRYTDEGYLMFEGELFSEEQYAMEL